MKRTTVQANPNVILARHGLSAGNVGSPTENMSGIKLTLEGGRQANKLTSHILERYGEVGIAHIITTPYVRTGETAAPLIAQTGIQPMIMPDLREITYLQASRADGKTYKERAAMRHEFWEATRQDPEHTDLGEEPVDSVGSFLRRIKMALGDLAIISAQGKGVTVAYAHEYSISVAVSLARGIADSEIITRMIDLHKPSPAIRNTQAIGLSCHDSRLILAHESDIDLFPEQNEITEE